MNPLLEALSTLGNIVDTPGSIARGLLAAPFTGQWDRPFTGILDPTQRVYGSEWTGNPWTGAAVDIATDPLNVIGGIGLARGLRAAGAARAANAERAALLATGGMPEEIAGLTKVVDKAGNPIRTYHGTPHVFDQYDLAKADPNALYGKGVYTTLDPEVASTYPVKGTTGGMIHEPIVPDSHIADAMRAHYASVEPNIPLTDMSPENWVKEARYWVGDNEAITPEISAMFASKVAPQNVRMHYVDARKILNLDKDEAAKLYRRFKKSDKYISPPSVADDIPDLAMDLPDVPQTTGDYIQQLVKEGHDVPSLLKQAGFDAMRHRGGAITGGKPHHVVIALDPSQIYSPWIAPAARHVPSQSPLLAALAGLNVGRLPTYLQSP